MSLPRELGGRYRMLHLDFCVDAGDPNLGLNARTAGALPTEPPPRPSLRAVPVQTDLIFTFSQTPLKEASS